MGNVRTVQLRQDLPLDLEARVDAAPQRTAVDHLDGHLLFEFGVGPFGEADLAHAADTQGVQKSVGAHAIADQGVVE